MKSRIWTTTLILLIPLGQLKAIFYFSKQKVSWYILSDHSRYIDNVLEDYGNAFSFIIIFAYMVFAKKTAFDLNICKLYFVIACLDLLHLGAYDMQGLIAVKFVLSLLIWSVWAQQNLMKKLWLYIWRR